MLEWGCWVVMFVLPVWALPPVILVEWKGSSKLDGISEQRYKAPGDGCTSAIINLWHTSSWFQEATIKLHVVATQGRKNCSVLGFHRLVQGGDS